jgi:hypothetical protein
VKDGELLAKDERLEHEASATARERGRECADGDGLEERDPHEHRRHSLVFEPPLLRRIDARAGLRCAPRSSRAPKPGDFLRDAPDRRGKIEHHELRVEPEDGVPRAGEGPISARIGRVPSRMILTVDLDDEAHLGS